ncbi:putative N-acetyltransferase p20 [Fibrisoma limi BUZ 3]|uniref:Putative N-acetyltransferase p20 n=1 Tax=Fibrisoma limi BUZ 3 TaxID=1185876 RepID=I2GFK1_9BACT|nr:GNAT family N-acetyltransferase [Fibrisoma limi]CCH52676.1 putative N-acetyltransferase p20 [Fibrisoma limi BUZ 3]
MITDTLIQTERLILKPMEPTMREELHPIFTDSSVRRYLMDNKIVGIDWVDDVTAASQRQFEEGSCGLWAIYQKQERTIIGFCGYIMFDQLQLGYGLLPNYWGQGYATEASRAVVNYGFRQAGMTEIIAAADVPNTASFGVMKRLGMTFWKTEGALAYYRLPMNNAN